MKRSILSLIKKASTNLPKEVEESLKKAFKREAKGSSAKNVLRDILQNIKIARDSSIPLCQDTGTANFFVTYPEGVTASYIKREIIAAMKMAVKKGYLRPNAVESISGRNTGNGVGDGNPNIYLTQSRGKNIKVTLLLKGGGSENVSAQYSLPDKALQAYRDLNGIKRCVIDAAFRAQGRGCAPGIIGVGVGGDRASSYMLAKRQLLRKLDDTNSDKELAKIEKELLKDINTLDIGPMGLKGSTTALGVKIGAICRVPASFFVSIAYMCWAARRAEITIKASEEDHG